MAGALQRVLQRMKHFGAHAHGFGDARGAHRHDHEFLEVDRIVGVHAAVDDVHHRHGQQRRFRPADIAIERLASRGGLGLGRGHRHAENGVGAEPLLVRGAVEIAQELVEPALVGGVEAGQALSDLAIDGGDRLPHALAAVARPAISELMRLMRPGRGAGGHRGAAMLAVLQDHVDLDRRVAAAVENFPAEDGGDGGHAKGLSKSWALLA